MYVTYDISKFTNCIDKKRCTRFVCRVQTYTSVITLNCISSSETPPCPGSHSLVNVFSNPPQLYDVSPHCMYSTRASCRNRYCSWNEHVIVILTIHTYS